jgi:hypothetical protein
VNTQYTLRASNLAGAPERQITIAVK